MASIDTGGGSRRRALNHEINMIPFIDLLMVTIAFLLITAVWVSFSRIETGQGADSSDNSVILDEPVKTLHIYTSEGRFRLSWKQGPKTLTETMLPMPEAQGGEYRYPELASRIVTEWRQHGVHRDLSDRLVDSCVFHSEDHFPFAQMVAVMDAIHTAKRQMRQSTGRVAQVSAFNVMLATR